MRIIASTIFAAAIFWSVPNAHAYDCSQINQLLSQGAGQRACRTSDDCASIDLPPQFGCHATVSKDAAVALDKILSDYKRSCGPLLYTCYGPPVLTECERGSCISLGSAAGPRAAQIGSYDASGRPLH